MENLFNIDKCRTFMGKYIDPLNPDPDAINLVDIAHALSNQCRWGGHVMRFYSIAEHSIFVQNMVFSWKDKIAAMLHDASEAYISDIVRPVKRRLTNYQEIEHNLMTVISNKYGFEYPLNNRVHDADNYALKWEWVNLVLADRHQPLTPSLAKRAFLTIMDTLTNFSNRE